MFWILWIIAIGLIALGIIKQIKDDDEPWFLFCFPGVFLCIIMGMTANDRCKERAFEDYYKPYLYADDISIVETKQVGKKTAYFLRVGPVSKALAVLIPNTPTAFQKIRGEYEDEIDFNMINDIKYEIDSQYDMIFSEHSDTFMTEEFKTLVLSKLSQKMKN